MSSVLLCGFWISCSHNSSTLEPEVAKHGDIVVDKLAVAIIYDDTPGFGARRCVTWRAETQIWRIGL